MWLRAIEKSSCTRSLEKCVWEIRPTSNAALTIIGPTMGQRSSESSTRTTIVLYYCTRSYKFDAVTPPENLFDASLAQFQIVSSMSTKEVAQGRRRNRCPNAEPRNLVACHVNALGANHVAHRCTAAMSEHNQRNGSSPKLKMHWYN